MDFKTIILFLITFVVAACSIIYELLFANTLSLMAGSTIFWYSLTIGAFLAGLGLGSFAKTRIFPKDDLIGKFFKVEIILSVLGASIASAIFFAHSLSTFLITQHWGQASIYGFFILSFILILAVGFFSGIELPLLMDLGNSINSRKRSISNRVLGADYFGSLAGAILFPLMLVPWLSSHRIGFAVAIANLLAALIAARLFGTKMKRSAAMALLALPLIVVLTIGFLHSGALEQYFAKKYYYYLQAGKNFQTFISPMKALPEIERIRSPYQQIDVMEPVDFSHSDILVNAYFPKQEENELVEERMLYLNGDWQLATYTEQIYHEYFAHVPISLSAQVPKKILVLGGGDGLLDRELLKYQEVEKITHVELDVKMIELGKFHPVFNAANQGALHDERVDLVVGDGYEYVHNTGEKFDAIFIDFPVPADYNTSKIYSREFYHFVARALKNDGFMVMDAPDLGSFTSYDESGKIVANEEHTSWLQYYHTLKAAGFQTVAPFTSTLEADNPQARQLAGMLVDKQQTDLGMNRNSPVKIDQKLVEAEREREIEQLVKNMVLNMQEGFILAKKERLSALTVGNQRVDTIINPKRIQLAFSVQFSKDEQIDWDQVNSIMKPTLPKHSPWRIRLPYVVR